MRFIFSLVIILFLSSANISAADTKELKFDNEKIKTVVGWTVAIVFIFFIMMLGASDGGRNDDMYENSRQIRR